MNGTVGLNIYVNGCHLHQIMAMDVASLGLEEPCQLLGRDPVIVGGGAIQGDC